jgi:hypothetical protein
VIEQVRELPQAAIGLSQTGYGIEIALSWNGFDQTIENTSWVLDWIGAVRLVCERERLGGARGRNLYVQEKVLREWIKQFTLHARYFPNTKLGSSRSSRPRETSSKAEPYSQKSDVICVRHESLRGSGPWLDLQGARWFERRILWLAEKTPSDRARRPEVMTTAILRSPFERTEVRSAPRWHDLLAVPLTWASQPVREVKGESILSFDRAIKLASAAYVGTGPRLAPWVGQRSWSE